MHDIASALLAAGGLAGAAIGLGHVKAKGQSALGHYATHYQLLRNPQANRIVGELIGVLAMNTPFEIYRSGADGQSGHVGHHRRSRFAGPDDEETQYVLDLGFKPGMTREALWRNFYGTMFSPRFHWRQSARRVKLTFSSGPWWRVLAAWLAWGGAAVAATLSGLLPALLLGVVLPLLVVGNGASLAEQCAEHRWLVSVPEGENREFALSHGRFFAPMPPDDHSPLAWLKFWWRVLKALLARILVVQTDLAWHISHHIGLDRKVSGMVPWADAAQAYSPMFWDDDQLAMQSHTSLHNAIDAWFIALAAEPAR